MKNLNINLIVEYYFKNNYSLNKIAKIIGGVSYTTIGNHLKRHGYKLNNKTHNGNNRKHNINNSFFKEIDNKNKAYILGLIISDGCINNEYKLTFTSKDVELVEIFKRELKSEHKLSKYEVYDKRTNKTYTRYSLQIASKEIVNDLKNIGIYSKKSFDCKMPNIPENLFWHFLRGIFDGDGSVSKEKKNKIGRLRFQIIGSEYLIEDLKKYFNYYGLSNTKISITKYHNNTNNIVNILYYSYNDLSIIKSKMYEDSEGLRLTRKYDLFQTLKKYKKGSYDRTSKLKQIEMYDIDNNYIKTFKNIHDVCNYTNITYKMIHRVAKGERKYTNGYIFKYI